MGQQSLGAAAAKYGVVIAAALSVKFGLSITLLVDAIIKVIPSTAGALGSWGKRYQIIHAIWRLITCGLLCSLNIEQDIALFVAAEIWYLH